MSITRSSRSPFESTRVGVKPILARRSRIAIASFRSGASESGSLNAMGVDFGAHDTRNDGRLIGGWSPTYDDCLRSGGRWNTDVYLVGVDGGHLRRLTTEPTMDGVPSWSRDGQWIYSYRHARSNSDVGRLPKGGNPSDDTTRRFEPRESSTAVSLLSRRHPGGAPIDARMMRVPVDGGHAEVALEAVRTVSVDGHAYRDRVRHARADL